MSKYQQTFFGDYISTHANTIMILINLKNRKRWKLYKLPKFNATVFRFYQFGMQNQQQKKGKKNLNDKIYFVACII